MTTLFQQIFEGALTARPKTERVLAKMRPLVASGEVQVFKLGEDFQASVNQLLDDPVAHPRAIELAKPLARHMWIECPASVRAIGETEQDNVDCIVGAWINDNNWMEIFVIRKRGKFLEIVDSYDGFGGGPIDQFEFKTPGQFGSYIRAALALMNIPGASTTRQIVAGQKLQRARARNGKTPIFAYNEVVLLTQRAHGAEHTASGEGGHKRRHHVIGHIRLHHANEPFGEWSWVKPHWRGDAGIGIVLKEREVHPTQAHREIVQ